MLHYTIEMKKKDVLLRFIYPVTVYLYMADSNDPLELELELRELVWKNEHWIKNLSKKWIMTKERFQLAIGEIWKVECSTLPSGDVPGDLDPIVEVLKNTVRKYKYKQEVLVVIVLGVILFIIYSLLNS